MKAPLLRLSGILLLGLFLLLFPSRSSAAESFQLADYAGVEKIDVHVHLKTENTGFVELARKDRFRFLSIAVHSADAEEMEYRHQAAYHQHETHPDRVAIASSFPLTGWSDPLWGSKTIEYLDGTFERGAVAVKVWKNIGMEFKDESGKYVMIDHSQFDPVFTHLARKEIRLIGHLGEPKNCWLPLAQMTVKNDQSYFRAHPEYHMYLHPEMPSYEDQMSARDRMLEKNPELHFMGAHFASLEWSVDELAKFLDRFPRAVVDTAARMGQLQYQSNRDWERVRQFLIKYQDRILYGTDLTMSKDTDPREFFERAHAKWTRDWRYLNTEESMSVPELDEAVKGLALPKQVVEKIYRLNALRTFPHAWEE